MYNNLLSFLGTNDGIYAEFQSIDVDLDSRKFFLLLTFIQTKKVSMIGHFF